MKALLLHIADRMPYVGRLRNRIREVLRDAGAYYPGHYYSPIPSMQDIQQYIPTKRLQQKANQSDIGDTQIDLPGIEMNARSQLELLQTFASYYSEVPFSDERSTALRYYYNQRFFRYADAVFLYCFIRHNKPRRIIEVGSGFSSAVMLDTIERTFDFLPEITFIEPYPHHLNSLLRPQDKARVKIIERKVQEVPIEVFGALQSGDFLFIDSTHVVKFGSDVHYLLLEVIPRLQAGVFVHFHDIFYPFEYPADWLRDGIYWNENYFARAFLINNSEWSIYFFNTYVAIAFRGFLSERMPLCVKDTGGSLYIQRTGKR